MLHSRSSWAENDAKVGVRGEDLSRVSGSLGEIFTHVSSTPRVPTHGRTLPIGSWAWLDLPRRVSPVGNGMNATIEKFGYPATQVRDFEHWVVLLRPVQVTLGSLILAAKGEATAFGSIEPDAARELQAVARQVEATLSAAFGYERLNYLMLMMVDPHVHFHVIPRYSRPVRFQSSEYPDPAWPKAPDVSARLAMADEVFDALLADLRQRWKTD